MKLLTRNYIDPAKPITISLEAVKLIFDSIPEFSDSSWDHGDILSQSKHKLKGRVLEQDPVTLSNTTLDEITGKIQYEILSDGISYLFEINEKLDLNYTTTIEARSNPVLLNAVHELGNRAFYGENEFRITDFNDLPQNINPKQLMFSFDSLNQEIPLKSEGEYILSETSSLDNTLVETLKAFRWEHGYPGQGWSLNNDQYVMIYTAGEVDLVSSQYLKGKHIEATSYVRDLYQAYERLSIDPAESFASLKNLKDGKQAIFNFSHFPSGYFSDQVNFKNHFEKQLLFKTLVANAERNGVGENLTKLIEGLSVNDTAHLVQEKQMQALAISSSQAQLGSSAIADIVRYKREKKLTDYTMNLSEKLLNNPSDTNSLDWKSVIDQQYNTQLLSGKVYESHLIYHDPTHSREPFSIGIFIDNNLSPAKQVEHPVQDLFKKYNNRIISAIDLMDILEREAINWNLKFTPREDGGYRIEPRGNSELSIDVKVKLYTESYQKDAVIEEKKLLFNDHDSNTLDIRPLNNARLKWLGVENNLTPPTLNPIVAINRELYVSGYELNPEIETKIYKTLSSLVNTYLVNTEKGDSITLEVFKSADQKENPLSLKVEIKNSGNGVTLNLYKTTNSEPNLIYRNPLGEAPHLEKVGFQVFNSTQVLNEAKRLVNQLSDKLLSSGIVLENENKSLIIEKISDSKLSVLASGIFETKFLQFANQGVHHEVSVSSYAQEKILSEISINLKNRGRITISEPGNTQTNTKSENQENELIISKPARSTIQRL